MPDTVTWWTAFANLGVPSLIAGALLWILEKKMASVVETLATIMARQTTMLLWLYMLLQESGVQVKEEDKLLTIISQGSDAGRKK
jgi:hypothetical protein